ncbi:carbohydrate ABC transporter permease [Jiangella rhizosphaerae]|uniref:Sugar ABC transporter permease n=1 Tax=Jiangella rhizosphaerae TaxID=2293569 RepID=A0A418KGX2_9ACTN|nr:sugar ABC transporter permease [Jiangella rhizosphaerae]RIQ11323.1 sugar ABC transporter permease [Jiangella rhizosphaerae]
MTISVRDDRRTTRTAFLLIAPALTLIALFVLAPGVLALVGSFFEIDLTSGVRWTWVGLDNFAAILGDDVVLRSVRNTLVYCVLTIVPSLAIGLGLALLVESMGRGRAVLRTLLFLPFTANLVAMAVVFRWIFALNGGFANQLLGLAGLGPLNYLGDERLALPTVAAVGIWRGVALTMVLFLAGLTSIPTAVHEAAAADGIRGLAKLRTVTLPLLRPIVVFATVMTVLGAVQVFDTVNVMTGGGPLYATETVLTMTWQLGFGYFELGQAAALSVLVLAVLIGIGVWRRRSLMGARR